MPTKFFDVWQTGKEVSPIERPYGKYLKDNSLHFARKKCTDISSLDNICSSKLTVSREPLSVNCSGTDICVIIIQKVSSEVTEMTTVSFSRHSLEYCDRSQLCVPETVYAIMTDLFLFSFRKEKPSWKEIARNKSRLVSKLLKGYDKRIRPYTGGRKDNLFNKFYCTVDAILSGYSLVEVLWSREFKEFFRRFVSFCHTCLEKTRVKSYRNVIMEHLFS